MKKETGCLGAKKQKHTYINDRHPNNVNRDTEIVQPRYRPDTVMIEQAVRDQDSGVDQPDRRGGGPKSQEGRDEQRTTVVHGGQSGNEADDIEPSGEPPDATPA